jgi:hypothetical protein
MPWGFRPACNRRWWWWKALAWRRVPPGSLFRAALAVQEGGFALAAMSIGLPESVGLSLSLVKRVRKFSLVSPVYGWLGGMAASGGKTNPQNGISSSNRQRNVP